MSENEAIEELNDLLMAFGYSKTYESEEYNYLRDEEPANYKTALAIDTVLNLLKSKNNKIDILHATLAENVTRTVCSDIKQSQKHKDDLEMLYKGCQIENEELKNTMYKMASFIASQDIECDICEKTGKLDTCDSMAYGECENCIIKYFKDKGENNG